MALPIVGKFFSKTYKDPKFSKLKNNTFPSPEPELLAMLNEPSYREILDIEKRDFDIASIFKRDSDKTKLDKKQQKTESASKKKKRLWTRISNAFKKKEKRK